MLPGAGAYMGDDIAALEQRQDRAHRRERLADVDHDRQIKGGGRLLRASQRFEIVGAGHVFRQSRLDADDDVTIACDRSLRQGHVGGVDVVQLAARSDAGARNIHQGAADLRRSPRDGGDLIDVVGAARAGIDPAGYAVLQGQLRPFLATAGMGVDVDQARGDDLAARIDRLRGVGRDVGVDRRDLAAGIATSRIASSPTEGSMTSPPLMIRSKVAARTVGTRANIAAPVAAAHMNWRLFIMVLPTSF
jgi:hypothetical protein